MFLQEKKMFHVLNALVFIILTVRSNCKPQIDKPTDPLNWLHNLLPFSNKCQVSEKYGVCETVPACLTVGGLSIGSSTCPTGKICCQQQTTCGKIMTTAQGAFHNPKYPNIDNTRTMCHAQVMVFPSTCAISVRFTEFRVGTKEHGLCNHDYFTILNLPGGNMMNLCGAMDGHWQIFTVDSFSTPVLEMYVNIQTESKWLIHVTQHDNCQPASQEYAECGKAAVPTNNNNLNYWTSSSYPWVASLARVPSRVLFCGATLITLSHVITDPQCIYDMTKNDFSVIMGVVNPTTVDPYPFLEENIDVDKIIYPWTYKQTEKEIKDKFAIVKMASPTDGTTYLPLCLPSIGTIKAATSTIFSGRNYDGIQTSGLSKIDSVSSLVTDWLTCFTNWKVNGITVDSNHFCVTVDKDKPYQCQSHRGHSVSVTRDSGRHELGGVFSHADCIQGLQKGAIFTSLDSYRKWLQLNLS